MPTSEEIWSDVHKATTLLTVMRIPYVLVGSLAGSSQGAPRTTNDADLLVAHFPGREAEFAKEYGPEYYVSLPAIIDANLRRSSFNIINTQTSFKLDFFVQKQRPYDVSVFARRQSRVLPEGASQSTDILSPEDLVLSKLEWYRLGGEVSDRQWKDVMRFSRPTGRDLSVNT